VSETRERTGAIEEDFTEDPRYAASRREMIISFVYFGVYTFVLIGVAWLIGEAKTPTRSASSWAFRTGFSGQRT
jgi:hypothetical protein